MLRHCWIERPSAASLGGRDDGIKAFNIEVAKPDVEACLRPSLLNFIGKCVIEAMGVRVTDHNHCLL
jgi:hypothetical protein